MSMKILKLHLHCTADTAATLLELIDQLRDAVAENYADDIRQMMQAELERESEQVRLPFDDPLDF